MDSDYAIELTKKLVSIATPNPPGEGYEEIASILATELEAIGFDVKLIRIPDSYLDEKYPYAPLHRGRPRVIVYGRIGSGNPILHFNGHYDVVPAGEGWSTSPYQPVLSDGKLYGRGSSDMKAGIAAFIAAAKEYLNSNGRLEGSLEAVFVPDEETGGLGTRYLIENRIVKPDYVIIGEPTPRAKIVVGHRGILKARIRIKGKQAHASMPWLGRNAFIDGAKLVIAFSKKYSELLARKTSKVEPDIGGDKAIHPTIVLGGYAESKPGKSNIVPGEFVISVDRRIIPEEGPEEVLKELSMVFDEAKRTTGVKAVLEINDIIPPAITKPDSKLVFVAATCISDTVGVEPSQAISLLRSDATFYIHELGVEAINYGPGDPIQAHAVNEYVEIKRIRETIRIYTCIIRKILG